MARPISFVKAEILRVAEEEGFNPREQAFTRRKFLPHTEVSKRDLARYDGFTRLKQDAADEAGLPPLKDLAEARGVQLRRNYVRTLERRVGQNDYLSGKLNDMVSSVFEKNPIKLSPGKMKTSKKISKRMLTLLLSDLHFGVDVDPREVLKSEFNWDIAARRLAKLCHQAADYKKQHRAVTELQVVLNGDILHGVVHMSEAKLRPLTEQIYGATSILLKALDYLRCHFSKVSVLCLPGNHDRPTYRGRDRALSQRWDSHSHAVFLGLKCAFREDDGITFDIPMAGMGTYEAPGGHLIYASHGDVEPGVGNVGKAISVKDVTNSLLKMNAGQPFDKKVEVALFGHWHQPSIWMLQDGTICIVNGCLLGSDPYAQNAVGFFNSMPAQIIFESVPGYPVGDARIVQLRDADAEAAYDKVISLPGLKGGLDFEF
jgi:hypothetical protein